VQICNFQFLNTPDRHLPTLGQFENFNFNGHNNAKTYDTNKFYDNKSLFQQQLNFQITVDGLPRKSRKTKHTLFGNLQLLLLEKQ